MSVPDPRPTLAAPDDDPHLWLEDIEGPRALDWVEAQNAATLQRFGGGPFARDRDTLKAILDRPDNIPYVTRRGGKLFNLWRDAAHPRGLWRTTTLESFRSDAPDWDVLIDLDALAAMDCEDWILKEATTLPGTHDRAVLGLSRGGADAVVLREFDLATRDFLPDGFHLAEAHSGIAWLDRDSVLLMSSLGPDMATRPGYARTVRLWRRGTDPLAAPVIFESGRDSVHVYAGVDRDADDRLWFVDKLGGIDHAVWIGDRTGPKTRIDVPSDVWLTWRRGWLAVTPRTPWTVGGATYGTDTLLGISFEAFLAGDRRFATLFEPGPRRALQHFFFCGDRLVLSILDDLKPVFEVLTPASGAWSRQRIAGLPDLGTTYVWPFDEEPEETNGDLLAGAEDPLTPPSLFLVAPGTPPVLLKQAPPAFDAAGLVITRHEAVSSDGTRIPYTQVGPAGPKTGDAPVHLYGYGGFNISMPPYYNPALGKLWLEPDGTGVIAHLRGGREFGTDWYEAARREGRRLAHDDFAAVAADLVRRGVTRPGRIAAEGGSNGGLLIANMLTRYPERFGALFCAVPVIDMRRYAKLLIGAACIDEYGDPDKPEDWRFLGPMSAYHVAAPGQPYPPILLATSRRDDRVHPGHARKMAAKLQAMGYDAAYFYEPATGGHAAGKDHAEEAAFMALGYGFLRDAIGWAP